MIAVDTNVLVYAEGADDLERRALAAGILWRLDPSRVIVPVQVLGELHRVLTRKAKRSVEDAGRSVRYWAGLFQTKATGSDTLIQAVECAAANRLQIWDAIILASAAEAGAIVLLSEDMHHGFVWNGVTVANPFAPAPYEDLLVPYLMPDG